MNCGGFVLTSHVKLSLQSKFWRMLGMCIDSFGFVFSLMYKILIHTSDSLSSFEYMSSNQTLGGLYSCIEKRFAGISISSYLYS